MRVELLYWDEDPNYMRARQDLVDVLTEDAFETTIQMIAVNSEEDARLLEFPGSPTIRIDGRDILPQADGSFRLGLREYPVDDGSSAPTPAKALIRGAIERARGWGHGRHS